MQIENITVTKITASEGKTFASKETGKILSNQMYLGSVDSLDNYTEVDEPKEEENEPSTINH
jgi:hypothetical protein